MLEGTPIVSFWDIHSSRTSLYGCVLYCGMHRCGEFVNNVVKLKRHLWHMPISYGVHYIYATHTYDLNVSRLFLHLQFRFIPAYFIEGLACTADLRILGINGCIISDRCLVISGWTISPVGMYTNCIFLGYSFVTNVALWMCTLLRYAPVWRICK